jgi:hypothetical protein
LEGTEALLEMGALAPLLVVGAVAGLVILAALAQVLIMLEAQHRVVVPAAAAVRLAVFLGVAVVVVEQVFVTRETLHQTPPLLMVVLPAVVTAVQVLALAVLEVMREMQMLLVQGVVVVVAQLTKPMLLVVVAALVAA